MNNIERTVVPPDFEPTPEERSLLALYGTVRLYEKERDKIKEEAAKAKLRAKDEQFRRENGHKTQAIDNDDDSPLIPPTSSSSLSSSAAKKKKKRDRSSSGGDANMDKNNGNFEEGSGGESDEDGESYDEHSDANEDPEDKASRRQKKLKEMRKTVLDEKGSEVLEEEERERHLQDGNNAILDNALPTVRKKQMQFRPTAESLLSSVENQSTPPHEFSKSLALPKASLYGKQMFPTSEGMGENWSPPQTAEGPCDGDLCIDLPEFDASQVQSGNGKNTIAIKFMAPEDSNRFSINITEPQNNNYADILFHFNPRQRQKGGQLVINDKQDGIWGQGINVPLSILPLIFGQKACTLILQINGEGFDVFLDGKHCARLEHRKPLPQKKCSLKLQFPSTDDYGSPENWKVFKIWWGFKKAMAGDLTNVPGVNVSSYQHPKKLFVSSLTKIYSEPEVELRRAELERAFRKYGGAQGCIVKVPTNSTFAFVEVETSRMADLALREMQSTYNMSRARRTRQEVLQEQREAAGKPAVESNEWD